MKILEWMIKYGLAKSKSDARRLIKNNAVKACDSNFNIIKTITDIKLDMGELKGEKI